MASTIFAVILAWMLFTCTMAFSVQRLPGSENVSDEADTEDGSVLLLTSETSNYFNSFLSDLSNLEISSGNNDGTSAVPAANGADIKSGAGHDDSDSDEDDEDNEDDEDDGDDEDNGDNGESQEDDDASHGSLLTRILYQIHHGHVNQSNVAKWFSQIKTGLTHGTISTEGYQRFMSALRSSEVRGNPIDRCCPLG